MPKSAQHLSPTPLITTHRSGFPAGYTAITRADDATGHGIEFGIHVLHGDATFEEVREQECVWILLHGKARVTVGVHEVEIERASLFDTAPTVVHLGPRTPVRLHGQGDHAEWAVARVANEHAFAPRLFWPHEVAPEYRGLGLAQGACVRNVRQVFDRKLRPESNLVVGEVVNYPGRWSSYPPHHHAQPEIYHYRFDVPHGYGHGEVGEQVYKVRQFDTLCIPAGQDHAQVAAPGYAMYYLWIVRHLDDNPYAGFEYTPDHTWMLDPKAPVYVPADGPLAHRSDVAGDGGRR